MIFLPRGLMFLSPGWMGSLASEGNQTVVWKLTSSYRNISLYIRNLRSSDLKPKNIEVTYPFLSRVRNQILYESGNQARPRSKWGSRRHTTTRSISNKPQSQRGTHLTPTIIVDDVVWTLQDYCIRCFSVRVLYHGLQIIYLERYTDREIVLTSYVIPYCFRTRNGRTWVSDHPGYTGSRVGLYRFSEHLLTT